MTPNELRRAVERRAGTVEAWTVDGMTVTAQLADKTAASEAARVAIDHGVPVKSLGLSTVEFTLPGRKARAKRTTARASGEIESLPTGEVQ